MSRTFALCLCFLAAGQAYAQGDLNREDPFKPFSEPINNFSLFGVDGDHVSARDLRGSIWVVQFFVPGCNECSKANPAMQRLQAHYRGKPGVKLVSIALRFPELRKDFARDQEADLEQWLFLGDPDEKRVHEIIRTSFYNAVETRSNPDPGAMIDHSIRLFLIDPHGMIVGYVNGADPKASEVLVREIDRLRLAQRIPITGAELPRFNAILNASCTVLLLLGWISIGLRWETVHKIVMLLALAVSMIFLASYLYYHFVVLQMEPMRFQGTGAVRYVYFTILLTHTILAAVVAPLAIFITVQGLRDARLIHVKLARWTLPIWLYVSVTGVVIYWMLYRMEW
jgi:protein SCO1